VLWSAWYSKTQTTSFFLQQYMKMSLSARCIWACPKPEIARRVSAALEQVGMSRFASRLSHHFSTGEKKRIAIATVLSMDPQILVLDEPTAGLDPRARRSLINLLGELPLTMLVSSHDLLMVRELFPRMIIMDEGRIVADGPTEILLADPSLLEDTD
jgi:cobalt/nickel transport system ATP-binding protein